MTEILSISTRTSSSKSESSIRGSSTMIKWDWTTGLQPLEFKMSIPRSSSSRSQGKSPPKFAYDKEELLSVWVQSKGIGSYELKIKEASFYAMEHLADCIRQGRQPVYNTGSVKEDDVKTWVDEQSKKHLDDMSSLKQSLPRMKNTLAELTHASTSKNIRMVENSNSKRTFSSPVIEPSEKCFLHKAIAWLNPQYAAEAFNFIGISPICVDDLVNVLDIEYGTEKPEVHMCSVNEDTSAFIEALHDLAASTEEYTDMSKHIVHTIVTGIEGNHQLWDELMTKYKDKQMFGHVINFLLIMKKKVEQGEVLKEVHLNEFVRFLLMLEGYCTQMGEYLLQLFLHHSGEDVVQPPVCTPDLIFHDTPLFMLDMDDSVGVSLEFNCPAAGTWPMVTLHASNNFIFVKIDVKLVWQVFEQELAVMMTRKNGNSMGLISQGGLIIANNQVRSIAIYMDMKTFLDLKNLARAEDTVNWLHTLAKDAKSWCRLYIDAKEYTIWDVVERAKLMHSHFSI